MKRITKGSAGVWLTAAPLTGITIAAGQSAAPTDSAMIGIYLGAVAVLGAAGLLTALHRQKRIPRWVGGMLLLLLPGLLFLLVEMITGNLPSIQGPFIAANLLLLLACVAVASLPFRRIRIGTVALSTGLFVLALAEHFVLASRGRSLEPLDLINFSTAAQVAGNYQLTISPKVALACEYFLLLLWLQAMCLRLEWPKERRILLLRWLAAGAAAAVVWFTAQPQEALYGPWRATVPDAATEEASSDIRSFDYREFESNYVQKGLLWSLYAQLRYARVKVPDGYSVERVRAIAESSEAQPPAAPFVPAVTPKNIILIMNESLTDMSQLGTVKTDAALLPYLHGMDGSVLKGSVQVPVFGGATSESEFEALTGNSKQFLAAASTAYMLYCHEPEYSLASTLRRQGYRTVALHPHAAANYRRDTAYPAMGFDEFISIDGWSDDRPAMRAFLSDEGAYREVIRVVEESGDAPVFAFLVTMQNHGGYSEASRGGYEGRVKLGYDQEYPEAELYLALANESDSAFQGLIEHFGQVDAPTMIILFGDHYPAIEAGFYGQLLENGGDLVQRQKYYQTPLVIWANYDLPEAPDLLLSANYLGSTILQLAGLRTTAYDRFLLSLRDRLPVIGMGMVMDTQGDWYSLADLPEPYQRLMEDYRIWQYNRVFDRDKLSELYLP